MEMAFCIYKMTFICRSLDFSDLIKCVYHTATINAVEYHDDDKDEEEKTHISRLLLGSVHAIDANSADDA